MYITEQCEFDNYTLDVIERITLSIVIDFFKTLFKGKNFAVRRVREG